MLVAARARLMQALPPAGRWWRSAPARGSRCWRGWPSGCAVAAVNGPASVVISGDEDEVLEIAARFGKTKRLKVSHAFHSSHMDGMLAEFDTVARSVSYAPPAIPFVSNLTGELATAEQVCSPEYWVRHVRDAVRFADGIGWLAVWQV